MADEDAHHTSSPASTADDYASARSRTASMQSNQSSASCHSLPIDLAPLPAGDVRVSVSSNSKRQFKDRRIYVNPRTGLPVRPPTSFCLFKHALRRAMGNKVDFVEFNRKATERWAKMEDSDKEPYVQQAKKLSDHFKKVEVHYLRKKVRELEHRMKEFRGSTRG